MNTPTSFLKIRISTIVATLAIFLFVYTGISKLNDHDLFQYQLHVYPMIKNHADLISWMVPIAELGIATLLFFSNTRLIGLWSAGALLIGFTIYLVAMVSQYSKKLPCSCGGIIQQLTWNQHIVFNMGFIALILYGIKKFSYCNKQVGSRKS